MLKIDVEGYEYLVLAGGKKTFSNSFIKAIIIELNSSGLRYGIKESDIHKSLTSYGFKSYLYNPIERKLAPAGLNSGESNLIYLRDISFVNDRIHSQRKISIKGFQI